MSEQHAQGADAVVDLNNELKTRREKLANLREQGIAFPNDFRVQDQAFYHDRHFNDVELAVARKSLGILVNGVAKVTLLHAPRRNNVDLHRCSVMLAPLGEGSQGNQSITP